MITQGCVKESWKETIPRKFDGPRLGRRGREAGNLPWVNNKGFLLLNRDNVLKIRKNYTPS